MPRCPVKDITIYEADERAGRRVLFGRQAATGYILPGSVFDKEFRCTFDLLATIPSAKRSGDFRHEMTFSPSMTASHSTTGAHIIDRDGQVVPHARVSA